jgi:hypothetical protein
MHHAVEDGKQVHVINASITECPRDSMLWLFKTLPLGQLLP